MCAVESPKRRKNETPKPMDVHGAADVNEANRTNIDSEQTSGLWRSG